MLTLPAGLSFYDSFCVMGQSNPVKITTE